MTQTNGIAAQLGQYAQVNGLNMYYEEYGSGRPLVLIHGGSATSQSWQPFISTFASHFKVITPDSRAHGKTDNPLGELSYRLMADDMAAFIQNLELDKPLVFGYSDGGQIALELGMRYPQLVGALVIGAAFYKFSELYTNWLKSIFEEPGVVNIDKLQQVVPELIEYWKAAHVRPDDPDYWLTMLKQVSIMWWTPLDYTEEDFQKFTEPALIFQGDRDEMIELDQAVAMYRLIPNAELAVMPNATHLGALMESKFTAEIVLDCFVRHSTVGEDH